jgi:hypothetical protein
VQPLLRLAIAILSAVGNRNDNDLLADFVDLINNNIWPLEKLARALHETGATHMH